MANRRAQPEVQKLFEKYVNNSVRVRRLDREGALEMLQKEFSLGVKASNGIMDYFDADRNGSLSLWEFQHFYNLAGTRAAEMSAQFETLDTDNKGYLTKAEMESTLSEMKSAAGKSLEEKDIEMIMKTAKDEDKIFIGDFIAILYRLRLYRN